MVTFKEKYEEYLSRVSTREVAYVRAKSDVEHQEWMKRKEESEKES
jgi:hypothetical protein